MAAPQQTKIGLSTLLSVIGAAIGGLTFVIMVGSQMLSYGKDEGQFREKISKIEVELSTIETRVQSLSLEVAVLKSVVDQKKEQK